MTIPHNADADVNMELGTFFQKDILDFSCMTVIPTSCFPQCRSTILHTAETFLM
jgi:hypothetical protein